VVNVRRKRRAVSGELKDTLVLSTIGFIVSLGQALISPILPLYALSFGVTVAMVGLLIASTSLARVLLDIPAGMVSDRLGVRRFMVAGLMIVSLSAVISGSAIDYWMLLFGLVLQGIGSAIYLTVSYIAIGRVVPRPRRGRRMSLYISLQFLGASTGPVLGGVVAQFLGLNVPFFLYSALVLISAPVLWRALRNAEVEKTVVARKVEPVHFRSILGNYALMAINLSLLSISLLRNGLLLTIVPLFAHSELALTPSVLGTVLTLSAAANFLILLPAGTLSDRIGRRGPMVGSLVMSAVTVIALPYVSDTVGFAVLMAALGLSLGLTGSIGAWVADVAPPAQLATAMGVFRTVGDLGSLIGPIILTSIIGPSAVIGVLPFIVTAAVLLLAAAVVSRARDPAGEVARKRTEGS
jgi:MFS family permease